jgi:DNA-directed RNA polymerase specialized sigma24 family protein
MFVIAIMDVSATRAEAKLGLDARSFGAFYDDALAHIYGYFLHRCGGCVTVAEDLTQETFVAAVAELGEGSPGDGADGVDPWDRSAQAG